MEKKAESLTTLQRQRMKGKEALARWRQRFFMECAGCHRIFWGTQGVRAAFLRGRLRPMMQRGDLFIEEDDARRGKLIDGLPVCIPDVLKDVQGAFRIVVLSDAYPRIRERLMDYGYVENVDFVEGRQLLGEDEHGEIELPCIEKQKTGMFVYGVGAHLKDMLNWHPELRGHISRVFDKDPGKAGKLALDLGIPVEPLAAVKDLPRGTEVAVAAIRYLGEITKDIHAYQPDVVCRSIDDIWEEYAE